MRVPPETKERLKKEIAECLLEFPEVQRAVLTTWISPYFRTRTKATILCL